MPLLNFPRDDLNHIVNELDITLLELNNMPGANAQRRFDSLDPVVDKLKDALNPIVRGPRIVYPNSNNNNDRANAVAGAEGNARRRRKNRKTRRR